jgi:eukaryotic-like serine/threonine-protein kinase
LLLALCIGGGFYLFTAYGYWLKIAYPALMLVAGYTVLVSKRLVSDKGTQVLEVQSVDTNRVLGLSFLAQGMLEMAFEKFRKCALDASMKEVLYGLALDCERKRQFTKALQVFEHIATVDGNFKDIAERSQKLRMMRETVILDAGAGN